MCPSCGNLAAMCNVSRVRICQKPGLTPEDGHGFYFWCRARKGGGQAFAWLTYSTLRGDLEPAPLLLYIPSFRTGKVDVA